ncbi:DUF2617 family protein [Dactylosporangium sp. CA-233914]|uniref:DUF2617 family protein n=1 Tax=Dactylosporangium sp. CA-233914 TaxID=3239934 RepID=UPI003D8ACFF4
MLVTLEVPYADTTAADLRFALDMPSQPALRVLRVGPVTLRLLGASHQIHCGPISETVAYLPAAGTAVPERFDRPGYRFRAEIRRLGPEAFAAECAELRARALAKQALGGVFGGARDALTVLAATPDGWWTAHAYPQTGELVLTETKVTLP